MRLSSNRVQLLNASFSKRNPRHLFFNRPQMIRLPPMERLGPNGQVRVERTLKFLPVGAISIRISVPFEVQGIEDLVAWSDGLYKPPTRFRSW